MPGKSDWALEGLPLAGRSAGRRRALDVMRPPASCGPDATLGEARERAEASGDPLCAVVDASGVLLGRIDGDALEGDPAARAGEVMEPQPPTEKPDTFLHSLAERLRRDHPNAAIETIRLCVDDPLSGGAPPEAARAQRHRRAPVPARDRRGIAGGVVGLGPVR